MLKCKCSTPVALLLSVLLSSSVIAARVHAAPSKWEEIHGWKSFGSRLAIAHDQSGAAIAIYDLSFPAWADPIPLAEIGGTKLSADSIAEVLQKAEAESPEQEYVLEEIVSGLQNRKPDEIEESVLPDGWWKSARWKRSAVAASANRPSRFALSDLDWRAMATDKQELTRQLDKANRLWKELAADNPELGSELLEQLHLIAVPGTRSYSLRWQPAARAAGVAKPKKLADLKFTQWGFLEAAKFELVQQTVGYAVRLIQVPVVGALIGTAVDRFFHFHKLLRRAHQNMALEAINDLYGRGDSQSDQEIFPSDALDASSLKKAIESLAFAQSSLGSSWKWIWKKPVEEFDREIAKGREFASQNAGWLADHGYSMTELNSRFARASGQTGALELRLISRAKPDRKDGPFVSYDSAIPDANTRNRIWIEILSTGVVFGSEFIPIAGGALKSLYKQLVENKIDALKAWEARLIAHLEQRQSALGENWSTELDTLDRQKANPLFPSRARTFELVGRRKAAFDIND